MRHICKINIIHDGFIPPLNSGLVLEWLWSTSLCFNTGILPTLLVYKNATEIDLMCCTSIGSFGDLMVTSNMAAVQFSGYLPKWNSTCIRGNITLIDSSGQCLLNISCKQYNNSQLDIVSLQIESEGFCNNIVCVFTLKMP